MGIEFTTAGEVARGVIYVFVYGEEGVGKTRLALSLSKLEGDKFGTDIAFVTAEPTGATTVATINPAIRVARLRKCDSTEEGNEWILQAARAAKKMAAVPGIKAVCIDGLHVLCGNTIDDLSDGEGEKSLGFEGWQTVLAQFRRLEKVCNAIVASGISVIFTALELAPQYATDGAFDNSRELIERGRPYLQGKAKNWMPAQCDLVCRMTSEVVMERYKQDGKKKVRKSWQGMMHLDRSTPYVCKTRWKLPSPYPADLRQLLRDVRAQKKAMASTTVAAPLKKKG